jgi:DNA helicase-2/ATP-dependent DNA helicase PcrA
LASLALQGLNPAQQEAVRTVDGPLLILAGPGSGKTRVIVHRVAYLLEQGIDPYHILAVTFTNKAAREMRERLDRLVEAPARHLSVGTFHATCARWLRRDIHHLGYDPRFAIFDENDQVDLVKGIAKDMAIDDRRFSPRMLLHEISSAKSDLIGIDDYARLAESHWRKMVADVYRRYQAALAENRALDFDDLLLFVVRLFEDFPSVLERYQERFRYVLVDEFQDTNLVQYHLTRLLSEKHRNVCVVGDPDQSIYGWRKADIRNILNFEHDYPDLKIVVLEQNYRSTQTILNLAQAVICANELRKEKKLWTENPDGAAVTLFQAFDEREEAQYVVREIERLRASGARLGGVAVMYRTNAQSRAVEDAFVRYGLPYRLIGGTRFYERREVKDVLAYLRLIANPYDAVSLFRIINVPPRGLGAKTVAELGRWARAMGVSPHEALTQAAGQGLVEESSSAPSFRAPFAPRARDTLRVFLAMFDELRGLRSAVPLPELINQVLTVTGYEHFLRDGSEDGEERWANVMELLNKARDYEELEPEAGLERFLEEVSLIQDVDSLEVDSDAATLITLHAAKGLEFPHVFILGVEEGLCPHVRSFDDPAQMEEERRLFYVGITRAMQGLYLLNTTRRSVYGASNLRDASRFLRDIPPELVEVASARGSGRRSLDGTSWGAARPTPPALSYRLESDRSTDPVPAWLTEPQRPLEPVASSREPSFRKGENVSHSAFGEGVVLESHVVGDDEQVSVLFKGQPAPKKLSLSFAPLQRV